MQQGGILKVWGGVRVTNLLAEELGRWLYREALEVET